MNQKTGKSQTGLSKSVAQQRQTATPLFGQRQSLVLPYQSEVLSLQRTVGNGAVGRLLHPEGENTIPTGEGVPPIVQSVFSRGNGRPLDTDTRSFMESRFGEDFSKVRLHTDAQAAKSAQALNARAYTVGRHIAFGASQYAPETGKGQKLLVHELTHVVQQQHGGSPPALRPNAPHELEADEVASAVVAGIPRVAVRKFSGTGIARTTEDQRAAVQNQLMQRLAAARVASGRGTTTTSVMVLTTPSGEIVASGQGRHETGGIRTVGGPEPPHAEVAAYQDLMRNVNPQLQRTQLELFVLTDAPACVQCQQKMLFQAPANWNVRVYHPETVESGVQMTRLREAILKEQKEATISGQTKQARIERAERIRQLEAKQRGIIRKSISGAVATLEIERQPLLAPPPHPKGNPPVGNQGPSSVTTKSDAPSVKTNENVVALTSEPTVKPTSSKKIQTEPPPSERLELLKPGSIEKRVSPPTSPNQEPTQKTDWSEKVPEIMKPERPTFETRGEVIHPDYGGPKIGEPGAGAGEIVGQGLAVLIPAAQDALQDKLVQDEVARRMLGQWDVLERWRKKFPKDWILGVVSLKEWGNPDPEGRVGRGVNYVMFYHGKDKQTAIAAWSSSSYSHTLPGGRWKEVGPFFGWTGPEESLDKIADELEGKRCFIATACYHSVLAPEVELLRRFRDDVLRSSCCGRVSIRIYYHLSPPIAQFLERHELPCRFLRGLFLRPIVITLRRTDKHWRK